MLIIYFQPAHKPWLSIFNLVINNIVIDAPIKNLSKRNIKELAKLPWITKGFTTSIKVKNKLYTLSDSFSTDEVNFKILSLSNKSLGLYSCPAQLLKCACIITSPTYHLYKSVPFTERQRIRRKQLNLLFGEQIFPVLSGSPVLYFSDFSVMGSW